MGVIRHSQARAALSVNSEMIQSDHHIGNEILRRQEQEKWGAKIIEHIASDLKESFPAMKGLSPRNTSICVILLKTALI